MNKIKTILTIINIVEVASMVAIMGFIIALLYTAIKLKFGW